MATTHQKLNDLMLIQEKMLGIMKQLSPVLSTISEEMNKVGDSAKKTTEDLEKTQTFLGKFIDGFLRKQTGGTGFFHRMMYGVDGYFIFKNRLDGMLSFIDRAFLRPIMGMGDKKDGLMSRVLMGVNEDFTKMKDLIFGPTPQQLGGSGGGPSPKKVKKFIKIGNVAFKFVVTLAGLVMKYLIYFGLALGGVFVIMKLLKAAGIDFKSIKGVVIMMKDEFLKYGSKLVGNLYTMFEGVKLIFSALFGDGDFNDLLEGYWMLISGFFMGLWNLFLTIAMPLIKGYIEMLKLVVSSVGDMIIDYFNDNVKEPLLGIVNFVSKAAQILGLIALLVGAVISSFPVMIAGLVVLFVSSLVKFFTKPFAFANGGVTRGGLSLVGERGPEFVRLPSGSRVHSNSESKRMSSGGHNITVNVQGRIGASDSELRQIAQKVGQMINKEINRTTSSRGLGA